jgi:hypothetical protein
MVSRLASGSDPPTTRFITSGTFSETTNADSETAAATTATPA